MARRALHRLRRDDVDLTQFGQFPINCDQTRRRIPSSLVNRISMSLQLLAKIRILYRTAVRKEDYSGVYISPLPSL